MVRPHLEYCRPIAARSHQCIKDKELLEKKRMQRRFTKMILSIQSLSYEERLLRTGLWALEWRRITAYLIDVYQIIHGLSSVSFSTFFERCYNSNTRERSLKLHKGDCILIYANIYFQTDLLISGINWTKNRFLQNLWTASKDDCKMIYMHEWVISKTNQVHINDHLGWTGSLRKA